LAKTPNILLINGPNLNMLGTRQPEVYGRTTLADIEAMCHARARDLGIALDFRQSNSEGEIVGWIQAAHDKIAGIAINPGAYSHTSVAILDALLAIEAPIIEVHLSNIHRREAFRHNSYVSQAAHGVICGFGATGYLMALDGLAQLIDGRKGGKKKA